MSELGGVVGRLAGAIADGEPIHWADVGSLAKSQREQELLRQLRAVAWLEGQARVGSAGPLAAGVRKATPFIWSGLLGLAAAQVLLAISSLLLVRGLRLDVLLWYQVAIVSSFGLASLGLVLGGGDDARPRHLGDVYLLTAAAFAQPLLAAVVSDTGQPFVAALHRLYPEAFLPVAFWRFARDFPRSTRFTTFDRFSRTISAVAIGIGIFLFATGWVTSVWSVPPIDSAWRWVWRFRRLGTAGPFWLVTFLLMAPALAASIWRSRLSPRAERLRAIWFLCAVGLGLLPLFVVVMLRAVFPGFRPPMPGSSVRGLIGAGILIALLSVPFTTGYAVVVHQVLRVRVAIHHALRRALARYTLLVVTALAVLVPVGQAYTHRDWTIGDLLTDPQTRLAGWMMLGGLALLTVRGRLLRAVDRLLVGESLDQARTLVTGTEAISRGRTAHEVAFEAARHIERTFDVSRVVIMLRRANDFELIYGSAAPPFPAETSILALLSEAPAVNVNRDAPLFSLLPAADREWLLRGRFDVLARVPLPDKDLCGIIGVGARRTGQPFSKTDLAFISALMTTTGLALHRPWSDGRAGDDTLNDNGELGAVECERCGSVGAGVPCGCAAPRRPARLPLVLMGKFEVVRRLGNGGMGVVYLANDVRLGRQVALKTLPRVSETAAAAMFEEAKTMARVEHQSLASIYSMEVWRSTPVLVVEYLAGGTLAGRLATGPLPVAEALSMGATLADALSSLHEAGILHRDIKPSNIGFTRAGTPKLLDFGVARLLSHAESPAATTARVSAETNLSLSTAVAGTPLYLSPEALQGAPPDIFVDLWSASVVVLEAMTGVYPFSGRTPLNVLARIRSGNAFEGYTWRKQIPPVAVGLFEKVFHPDILRRPQSARELASDLRAAAARVCA